MYIRVPNTPGLNDVPSNQATGKRYSPPFATGGEYVLEKDAPKILTVLLGPSPYQSYIQQVMSTTAASRLPKNFLRIVSSPNDVPNVNLRKRFVTDGNKIVGGTIDRSTGTIYMVPAPGRRIDTRVEFVLHEAVHLFADPFMSLVDEKTFETNHGRSCQPGLTDVGSFQRKYCFGFGEGATQAITEQILNAQGISKYYHDRPYDEFTPPMYELIKIFSLDKFARAYFWGAIQEFTKEMEWRWGPSWRNVANFTSARKTKLALNEIKRLELDYIKRRGPKGDFPDGQRYRNYA